MTEPKKSRVEKRVDAYPEANGRGCYNCASYRAGFIAGWEAAAQELRHSWPDFPWVSDRRDIADWLEDREVDE